MTRIATLLLALVVVAAPLTARADLYINFHGLYVLRTGSGCHLRTQAKKGATTSVVRCDPYGLSSHAASNGYTYTETLGRTTSDPHYGGCSIQVSLRALPPATHQFDVSMPNGSRGVVCTLRWQNNNTLDITFSDR